MLVDGSRVVVLVIISPVIVVDSDVDPTSSIVVLISLVLLV